MGEINILHLSDIHFKRDKHDDNPIPLIGRGIYRRRIACGNISLEKVDFLAVPFCLYKGSGVGG